MYKTFIIDNSNFNDFKGFCEEFSAIVLSGKYTWGGNLDALNDILLETCHPSNIQSIIDKGLHLLFNVIKSYHST